MIVCGKCQHRRKKAYTWLKQLHLPCPACGADVVITDASIAQVERDMLKALNQFQLVNGTITIDLVV